MTSPVHPTNDGIATRFDEAATLLEGQDANPFRVAAYRSAADVLRTLPSPCDQILARYGRAGLERMPHIGRSLARSMEELIRTGRWGLLEGLRGKREPLAALATVPGIGPRLATRIHERLGIETLADLEAAALDGRLASVAGMGPGRLRGVRESLAGRFGCRQPALRLVPDRTEEPPTAELLDIDSEYRRRATADTLPRTAPRRFNPTHIAWLPILHTRRGARHYTALYSNTPRAHELGTTNDWVVIYRDDHGGGGQWTVVTAQRGARRGQRIVVGRNEDNAPRLRRRTG